MPFISKDWRSPGEEWVKTEEGWEKKKILECGGQVGQENMDSRDGSTLLAHSVVHVVKPGHSASGLSRCTKFQPDSAYIGAYRTAARWVDDEDKENMLTDNDNLTLQPFGDRNRNSDVTVQPHCHITIKCTREIAGFNGLSDAFKRLDFKNAVRDVRRFNYICKLLDLIITQKLTMLSGCAQKVLFTMLEEVAYQVSASQQNIHMLNRLLQQLRMTTDCACWGRPLGSSLLWEQHVRTINRILSIANRIQIREPGDEVFPKLQNLPEECIREVLLRLADHKDLENSSKAYSVMQRLVDEQRIWRELCQFHFSDQQINFVLNREPELNDKKDWQQIYHKLRRSFTLREEYAEILQLCRNCRCLFWKSIGHPCIADQDPEYQEKLDRENVDRNSLYVPIPPQAFLKFFSL